MIKKFTPLFLLLILSLPLVYQSTPTEILKLKTFDAFVPDKEQSGYFTILNITDKDLEKYDVIDDKLQIPKSANCEFFHINGTFNYSTGYNLIDGNLLVNDKPLEK